MTSATRCSSVASATSGSEPVDLGNLATASTLHSLSRALRARRAEYVRPHRIRVKVGSWNVAACPGTDKDLASWFIDGKGVEPQLDTHLEDLKLQGSDVLAGGESHTGGGGSGRVQELRTSSEHASPSETTDPRPRPDGSPADSEPDIRIIGGSDIGLYVLGLQEVVSLNLVSQSLYTDPSVAQKWQDALEAALPRGYSLIASQQMSGLLLLIYASAEVAATVSNVSTVAVGTGLLGYMGNKGGISSRVILGETTRLVFTNCHLASGHDQANLDRRCWDYNKVLTQTQFSPVEDAGVLDDEGEKIGDEDFAFWFGDLNFRLDGLPGDDIRRLLMLHTRGEYDISKKQMLDTLDEEGVIVAHNDDKKPGEPDSDSDASPEESAPQPASFAHDDDDESIDLPDPDDFLPDPHDDPASLQATLDSLLPHDQLRRVIRHRKAFHEGWREGPITFLPSYKYDVGTVGLFDSSEKRRAPSWCDRILFRTRTDVEAYKAKVVDDAAITLKDEEMKKRGIDTAADDESVLFECEADEPPERDTDSPELSRTGVVADVYGYDEYDDNAADEEDGAAVSKDGYEDHLRLDVYTTHQRISSSDHKPIVAVFTLDYDAVVPGLKAKVHAEVARELDRAENEGRPEITVVVDGNDGQYETDGAQEDDAVLNFGPVGFMGLSQRSVTIANTGRASALVTFVEAAPYSGDEGAYPDLQWLNVALVPSDAAGRRQERERRQVQAIVVQPGETATAIMTVQVTSIEHLRALNEGSASLEQVTILRVADGKDHFLPLRAGWLPSCFGRSVEELIRIPPRSGGIRGFAQTGLTGSKDADVKVGSAGETMWKGGSISSSLPVHTSSPAELYKLTEMVESLVERAIADESMLQEAEIPRDRSGWPFDSATQTTMAPRTDDGSSGLSHHDHDAHIHRLITALDTDSSLADALPAELPTQARLELASEVLILFLRSITEGLVTPALFAKVETAIPQIGLPITIKPPQVVEKEKSAVLDVLATQPYYNIGFVFVTSMLAKVVSDLLPLPTADLEALRNVNSVSVVRRASTIAGRKISLRKSTGPSKSADSVNEAAVQRRIAWERRAAEIFGPALCRAGNATRAGAKEKKASEERMRGLVEVFLRRDSC